MKIENINNKLIFHVESGTIEFYKGKVYINCSCNDAIPFCGGFCCRRDSGTLPMLTKSEIEKFDYEIIDDPILETACFVLAKGNDNRCKYQKNGYCQIHNDKPDDCETWKCKVLELKISETEQKYLDNTIRKCKHYYKLERIECLKIE